MALGVLRPLLAGDASHKPIYVLDVQLLLVTVTERVILAHRSLLHVQSTVVHTAAAVQALLLSAIQLVSKKVSKPKSKPAVNAQKS